MHLGIDITNITTGGGLTHIREILNVADPDIHNFKKIIIFGRTSILAELPNYVWIEKVSGPELNKGLPHRFFWLTFKFKKLLIEYKCDLLFNPGGGYIGGFKPFVTMCRNMIVFDVKERSRYKYSKTYWRLLLLFFIQRKSFSRADGVIFISEYARDYLTNKLKLKVNSSALINHGVSKSFTNPVKLQRDIKNYSSTNPYKLLYVSIIDLYKHQWHLIKALHKLRTENFLNIELVLAGPKYEPAMKMLKKTIAETKSNNYVKYIGNAKYEHLNKLYKNADAFIFLSSCENMPNILIEAMSSGLPITCSNRSSMNEFLKDAGWYCNPEDVESIYRALKSMILDSELRQQNAQKAFNYSLKYKWEKCAAETFQFLQTTAKNFYQ